MKTHRYSVAVNVPKSKAGQVSHATWAHPKTSSTTQPVTPIAAPKTVISVESDVKLVLNEVISSVEREEIKTSKGQGQKGAPKGKSYDFLFKMNIIDMLDSGMVAEDVAFENRINKSLVSKWKKSRKDIIDGAATQHRKLLKKNRRSKKHDALFAKLIK